MNPEMIDRYQIISEIGRGGMAIVYLAFDPNKQRQVALKVLPPEYLYDYQFRQRFQREVDIMVSLRHPGIVPIYGYGQFQKQPYLVLRYLTGGSLEDRIYKKGSLSMQETTEVIEQIAPVLNAAHAKGVIHRDLKPSNVLFDETGKSFISDFGIARLTEQANVAALTGQMLIGSPAYMSPEQGRIGHALDGRSDVYSLGVMVFEMLTGEIPYQAAKPMQIVLKHIQDPIPDILALKPDLPPGCKQIIEKVLAKNPDERYASASELAIAMRAAITLQKDSARRQNMETLVARVPQEMAVKPASSQKLPTDSPVPIQKVQKSQSAPQQSPGLKPARWQLPRLGSANPRLPHSQLPASMNPRIGVMGIMGRFTNSFRRIFRLPRLRIFTAPYIPVPTFLRPVLRIFGISPNITLPTSKIGRVGIVAVILIFLILGCVLLGYFGFRLYQMSVNSIGYLIPLFI